MKNKKKFFSVLTLCVTLFGMFIIGCSNGDNKDVVAQGGDTEIVSTQSTSGSESSTEKSTESVDGTEFIETTEETESTESTEDTEEELPDEAESSLKEDEEILKITPTNDSVNNGSGSSEKEVYNAPAVASVDNPIVKVLTGKAPVEFSSGNIPAGKTWYYKVTAAKGYYFCIENVSASIIYAGKTYSAENGKVLLLVQEDVTEFAIKNSAKKAENFTVSIVEIEELTGTKENPKVIEIATAEADVESITANLKEGDEDGYYYSWEATHDGVVDFTVSAASVDDLKFDLIVTTKAGTFKMSEDSEQNADGTTLTVSTTVVKGEEVIIQAIAKKDGDTYPAVEAVFTPRCRVAGTIDNPIEVSLAELPQSITDVKIPVGKTYFEYTRNLGGTSLTVESTDITSLKVHQDNSSYEPVGDVISLTLAKVESTVGLGSFVIENTGTAEAACTLKFEYVEGTPGNPSEIVIEEGNSITVSHVFKEGEDAYCYQWKAPTAGTMKFDIGVTTDIDWQYSIVCETKNILGDISDSILEGDADTITASKEYTIESGDVQSKECIFVITVNTYAVDNQPTPAGTVSFTLSFTEVPAATNESGPVLDMESVDSSEEVATTETVEATEVVEETEMVETTEAVDVTEMVETTETVVEATEDNVEEAENAEVVDTTETVEMVEPIALRIIKNWYIRLFSK